MNFFKTKIRIFRQIMNAMIDKKIKEITQNQFIEFKK
jgi:hypothetical protein